MGNPFALVTSLFGKEKEWKRSQVFCFRSLLGVPIDSLNDCTILGLMKTQTSLRPCNRDLWSYWPDSFSLSGKIHQDKHFAPCISMDISKCVHFILKWD